ncbi:hypothetical protein [Marinobacter confluentis]|uniref:Uncharacterized protein n=1 Tax=Marinobacter confluentis TaxID=1697557 RepID=A0A4Z1C7G1_9GAMM|nr:hypothetical protein [Marinobacter confluentis]TGN41570.1 hypothetical protein E5Q11_03290 [Marinobacter confluentis]
MPLNRTLSAMLFTGALFSFGGSAAFAQGAESQEVPSPEEVKEEAQANTKYLAAQALKKAKSLMDTYGEFAPFGAGLFQDGEVNFVWAVKPGESTDGLNPILVLNAIRRALNTQAQTGRILGSAVIYQYQRNADGEVTPQINIELEYLNGYAEVIATEYEQGGDGIEFTSSARQQFEPKVFVEPNENIAAQ